MTMSVAEKYCLRVQAAKDAREEKNELRRKKRMAIEERLRKIREQRRKLRTQANKTPISPVGDFDFSKSPTHSDNDSADNVDHLSSKSNENQSNQSNESAHFSDPVEKVANSNEERRLPMVVRLMERIRQHREKQKKLKTMSSSLRNSDLDPDVSESLIEQFGPSDNVESSKPIEVETSEQNSNQSGNSTSSTIEMQLEKVEQEHLESVSSLNNNMEVERLEENSSKPVLVLGSTNDIERFQNLPHSSAESQKQEVAINSSSLDSTDKDKKDQPKSNSSLELANEMLEKNSFDNECLSKRISLRNVKSSALFSRDLEEKSLEQNSPHDELVDSTKDKTCSKKIATDAQKHKEPVKKAMTALNCCIYYTKPGQKSEPVLVDPLKINADQANDTACGTTSCTFAKEAQHVHVDSTPLDPKKQEEPVQKTMTVLNRCIVYTKPGQKLESIAQRNPSSLQNQYPIVCKDIPESSINTDNVDHLKFKSHGDQTNGNPCRSSSDRKAKLLDHERELVNMPTKKRIKIQNDWIVYTKEDQKPKPITKPKPSSSLGLVLNMDSAVKAFLDDTNDSKPSKVLSPIVDQITASLSAVDAKNEERDKKTEKTKGEKIRDFFMRIKDKVKQKQQNGEITMNQNPSSSKDSMTSNLGMLEAIPESQIQFLHDVNKLDPSKSSKTSNSIADQIKVLMSDSTSSTVDDGKVQKPLLQNPPQADVSKPIPNAEKCRERYKKKTPDLPIAEQLRERYKKRMIEPPKETANCSTTNTNVKLHDLFSRINPTKYTEIEEKGQIRNSKPLTCSDSIVSNNSTVDQNNKSFSETPPTTFKCFEKQSPNSGQEPNANNKLNNWEKSMQFPTAEQCKERFKKRMKEPNILSHSKFPKADILRRNTNVKLQDLFSRINDTKSTKAEEKTLKRTSSNDADAQEIRNHPLRKKARVETDTNSK